MAVCRDCVWKTAAIVVVVRTTIHEKLGHSSHSVASGTTKRNALFVGSTEGPTSTYFTQEFVAVVLPFSRAVRGRLREWRFGHFVISCIAR